MYSLDTPFHDPRGGKLFAAIIVILLLVFVVDYYFVNEGKEEENGWIDMENMEEKRSDEYHDILELTYAVCDVLEGTIPHFPYMRNCQYLATKVFSHAASIYYLSQGTKIPGTFVKVNFVDFSSILALTRITIEAYLKLYEIFFMPNNDDERKFRHLAWELQGFVIREKGNPFYTPKDRLSDSLADVQEIRDEIQETGMFKSLTSRQQDRIFKGKNPLGLGWKEVAIASGIKGDTFTKYFEYLHSYVHSDGLSSAQIEFADGREKQEEMISGCMELIKAILSKLIVNYHDTFEKSKTVCNNNFPTFEKVLVYANTLNLMP